MYLVGHLISVRKRRLPNHYAAEEREGDGNRQDDPAASILDKAYQC